MKFRVAVFGIAWAALAITHWGALQALWASWWTNEQGNSHGILIVGVVAWLLYRLRGKLEYSGHGAAIWLLVIGTLLNSIVATLGLFAGVLAVEYVMLPLFVLVTLLGLFGSRALHYVWFPALYLYFAVPIWGLLAPFLQFLTVQANSALLQLSNISAYINGNFVTVPGGRFEIAAGCSGIHFFVVGLALGSLHAYLERPRFFRIALTTAFFGLLAIIGNWIRVYIIIVAGYLTEMQHFLVTVDHYYFGWAVFAVMMYLGFVLLRRFERPAVSGDEQATVPAFQEKRSSAIALVLVFALAAGPLLNGALHILRSAPSQAPASVVFSDYQGRQAATAPWAPVIAGPDATIVGSIASGADYRVDVFEFWFDPLRNNHEIFSFDNRLLGTSEWVEQTDSLGDRDSVPRPGTAIIRNDALNLTLAIAYRFDIGEIAAYSERGVKAARVKSSLAGRRDGKATVFAVACRGKCDDELTVLIELEARLQR